MARPATSEVDALLVRRSARLATRSMRSWRTEARSMAVDREDWVTASWRVLGTSRPRCTARRSAAMRGPKAGEDWSAVWSTGSRPLLAMAGR